MSSVVVQHRGADKSLTGPGREKLQRQKILSFIYPIYNHNWRNISTIYTGLLISPSGNSELDCATTKKDRAERSISIGRESLKVFFLY